MLALPLLGLGLGVGLGGNYTGIYLVRTPRIGHFSVCVYMLYIYIYIAIICF